MKKRRVTDLSIEELAALAAEAGREAVEESRRLGLPVTGTKNGRIVRTYSDGREVVLKDLQNSSGMWEEIGRGVRKWRLQKNISQEELAERTQTSITRIKALEDGKGEMETMFAFLWVMGDVDNLYTFLSEE